MFLMKAILEPISRDLGAFLRNRRFPTLTEFGNDLERWRQRYIADAPPLSNDNP